jgi:predicted nucleotidyltransferase component of viral defense system
MYLYNVAEWVEAEDDDRQRQFREAVHVILLAISGLKNFKNQMLMKGGVLLAIRYNSTRYTRDIDFSTNLMASDFDIDKFLAEFNDNLIAASERLDYGLACKVQSHQMKPSSPEATFPTLKLKVGHAYKHETRNYKRLERNESIHVVAIDYSFNEISSQAEILRLHDGGEILAYSFTDLIAEKYRAIIQQETRNRVRRQDVYDIHLLLTTCTDIGADEKYSILKSLIAKSASRGITVKKEMLGREEIISRSKKEYGQLASEIKGDLPSFETAYSLVRKFYESLPWLSPA